MLKCAHMEYFSNGMLPKHIQVDLVMGLSKKPHATTLPWGVGANQGFHPQSTFLA